MIRPFRGILPTLGAGAFVDDTAVVIGDVVIGEQASVWMGAVIRGDVNRIRIGARTNIQDLCAIHADFGELWTEVAEEVTVGHSAILHGCRIGPRCLIGMGAKLLNGVQVGEESVVAAGAVVPEGMIIPPRSLVMGLPARVRRAVTDEEVAKIRLGGAHYVEYKELHRTGK
jgi:gamma-carbonic anhydrase